jgi:hypothetical protein
MPRYLLCFLVEFVNLRVHVAKIIAESDRFKLYKMLTNQNYTFSFKNIVKSKSPGDWPKSVSMAAASLRCWVPWLTI